ncbi:hypothetical protein MRX96_010411 [Rhipicephalus microplus]
MLPTNSAPSPGLMPQPASTPKDCTKGGSVPLTTTPLALALLVPCLARRRSKFEEVRVLEAWSTGLQVGGSRDAGQFAINRYERLRMAVRICPLIAESTVVRAKSWAGDAAPAPGCGPGRCAVSYPLSRRCPGAKASRSADTRCASLGAQCYAALTRPTICVHSTRSSFRHTQ